MQIRGGNEIYNNTKFGTNVLLRPETKELIEKSNAKEQIYQQITNLKNKSQKNE